MVKVEVGDRIESDGHYATVRFVGCLPHAATVSNVLWIGVEWDDSNRGKHDGSFKGVQYFETGHLTAGSFLRLEKCNMGIDYMTALSNRYGANVTGDVTIDEHNLFVLGRNQQTAVMAVGLEELARKQSQFSELHAISLRGMFISRTGNLDEVAESSKSLMELDISLNMLSNWEEVAKIVNCMPRLCLLNVSENQLRIPQSSLCDGSFGTVRSLFVNHMKYDWNSLFSCIKLFPVLENLHACYNRIDCVSNLMSLPSSGFLQLVNIEGNPISDWEKIVMLGQLPHLETLIVNDCGLSHIHFPGSCLTPTDLFPALTSLSICGNRITDWSTFNHLNRLGSLVSLRNTRNALPFVSNVLNTRYMSIVKIARLNQCNGAAVSNIERSDSELSYILQFGAAWKAAKASGPELDEFLEVHPRYQQLIQKYGAPDDSQIAPARSSALKNNLITVRIESKLLDRPPLVKELPAKMSVQRLKALIQRAFGITNLSSLRLIHISGQHIGMTSTPSTGVGSQVQVKHPGDKTFTRVELDNDMRELSFYSIEDGAVILAEW